MRIHYLLLFLLSAVCFADFNYNFSAEHNPLKELKVPEAYAQAVGDKLNWDNGALKTGSSNGGFYAPEEFTCGRVTLVGRDNYKSTISLLARATEDFGSYYSLRLNTADKKVVFIHHVYPNRLIEQEFAYDGDRDFALALAFDGKSITAYANGKKLGEFPDDGSLKTGKVGVQCVYWCNATLKSLTVESMKPVAGEQQVRGPEIRRTRNVPPLDIKAACNWDISAAEQENNGLRRCITLNQLWAFQPVSAFGEEPKEEADQWGYFVVPGYWAQGAVSNYMRDSHGNAVIAWNDIEYQKSGVGAWYKRTVDIPADWRGQKIELVLEDVCGWLAVFVGEKKVMERSDVICNMMRCDISEALNYGERNEIRICNGNKRTNTTGIGNASLWISPAKNFGDVAIDTKVSASTLELRFRGASAPADSQLSLVICAKDGKKLFEEVRPFANVLSYQWRAPILWTPDTPELYNMELVLRTRAGEVLDRTTLRFGYREFTAKDGKFWLNGEPIVVKAETSFPAKAGWWQLNYALDPAFLRPLFALFKQANLNCAYLSGPPSEEALALADEMGMMLLVWGPMVGRNELDQQPEEALKRLETALQQMQSNPVYGRHASQIAFLIDVWYGYNAGCTNPNYVGQPEKDPNQRGIPKVRSERLERMVALFKKYYPQHECFTGGSGKAGNIYATHIYHTWGAPSAELRAIFEDWSRAPKYPIFVGETYLPYLGSFYDLANFHGGGVPYVSENAARILGSDGYNYRTTMTARPFHDASSGGWFWGSTEKKADGIYGFPVDNTQAVTEKYFNEIMQGWRYHGLTGLGAFGYTDNTIYAPQRINPSAYKFSPNYSTRGYKPVGFNDGNAVESAMDPTVADYDLRPTLLYAPFAHAMATVSAAIYDKAEDPLLQNHSGYSGETLQKSVMLFNDSSDTVRMQLKLTLSDNQGHVIALGEQEVVAKPFEHKLTPVAISLPATANRAEWYFNAELSGAKRMHLSFPIQVFARPAPLALQSALMVYDPEGLLVKSLPKSLKYTVIKKLDALPLSGILLIGRNAIAQLDGLADFGKALEDGLNILVMEQGLSASPELLKSRTRQVFCNAPAHPVFDGLGEGDFAYWQDAHSIAPAKVKDGANINWSDWGNRNMVASYVFRRPQHGNWLSLLVSGFDLYQSPLLEYRGARGTLIVSQLEITERLGTDPVATRLFGNLLRYLDQPRAAQETVLFGDDSAVQFLKQFGVVFRQCEKLSGDALNNAGVLIVASPNWDALKQYRKELVNFVYFGGKVLYLHTGESFEPSWLPFTMGMGTASAPRAAVTGIADGTWLNGFGNSEFYWRTAQKLPVFENFPPHFEAANPAVVLRGKFGAGQWLFTTVTPERFKESGAIGKSVRFLSALFTSCGVQIANHALPYVVAAKKNELDLSEHKWEFATDKDDIGLKEEWQNGKGNGKWLKGLIADGVEVRVGQSFESFLLRDYNGVAWYRLTFDAPAELLNAPQRYFVAGAIDDYDEVYLNGVKIGATGGETPNYWIAKRNYPIPAGLLKPTGNLITVRVTDLRGDGGMIGTPIGISEQPISDVQIERAWQTPYPQGTKFDYENKQDIVRMY